jgi:hypothetical protein
MFKLSSASVASDDRQFLSHGAFFNGKVMLLLLALRMAPTFQTIGLTMIFSNDTVYTLISIFTVI